MIWISNKPYKTLMEGIKAYVNKHAHKHEFLAFLLVGPDIMLVSRSVEK
jgi:hypothetical protein